MHKALWILAPLGFLIGLLAGHIAPPPISAPGSGIVSKQPQPTSKAPSPSTPGGTNDGSVTLPPDPGARKRPAAARVESYSAPALSEILAISSRLHREAKLLRFFGGLRADELHSALNQLLASPNGVDAEALTTLFRTWAEVSPVEAVRQAQALLASHPELPRDLAYAAIRAWGRLDLSAAREWTNEQYTGSDQQAVLSYLDRLADPVATAAKDAALLSGQRQTVTLKDALAETNTQKRSSAITSYFTATLASDPAKAVSEALNTPEDVRAKAIAVVLGEWAKQDRAAALAWVNSLPETDSTKLDRINQYLTSVVKFAGVGDALNVAMNDIPGKHRVGAVSRLGDELFAKDPARALTLLAKLESENPAYSFGSFYRGWLLHAPDAAAEHLAKRMADPESGIAKRLRQNIGGFFSELAEKDVVAAARATTRLPDSEQPTAISNVMVKWAKTAPAEAAAWVKSMPAGAGQNEAMKTVAGQWAQYDPKQATGFVNQLPAGPGKTAAIEGFATTVFDSDPDFALQMARTIPNEAERIQVLQRSWRRWRTSNPKAANDWTQLGTLTEMEAAALSSR